MLKNEIKNIKNSKKDLQKFGFTIGCFFIILGVILFKKNIKYAIYSEIIGFMFLLIGFIQPKYLKYIHKIWMSIALIMGFFMTNVILIILFYFVLTPIKIISKLFGKEFIDVKLDENVNSYWIYRKQINQNIKDKYEKQF